MPTVFALVPEPKRAFLNSVGDPASGYKLFVYTAGSATKATTYTESDGNTANSNPVVLDSRGEPPSGVYAESGTYKMVLAAGTDTDPPTSPVWTRDNVSPINDTSTTVDQFAASGLTPTFVSSTQFTLVGDQRSTFHVGRRLKTANSAGTAYHAITASTYSAPNTTVTVANDSTVLDSGLSTVSLSILTADATGSIPGVEVSEDDWTFQGDLAVEGAATVTGTIAATGQITEGGSRVLLASELATQANMEAEASGKIATADLVKNSPGVAKFWCVFDGTAAGPISPTVDYNVVDVTDGGTGSYTVNVETDFSGASWSPYAICSASGGSNATKSVGLLSIAAGTVAVDTRKNSDNVADDSSAVSVGGFGDQ